MSNKQVYTKIWDADEDFLLTVGDAESDNKDIVLNTQAKVDGGVDLSHERLFTRVNETKLNKPIY
jgi:hypothetical protein